MSPCVVFSPHNVLSRVSSRWRQVQVRLVSSWGNVGWVTSWAFILYTWRGSAWCSTLFLQLGRKEEKEEGNVGIAASNNLSYGSCYSWGFARWHLIKAGENAFNLQHVCLFEVYLRVCALQLALFGMFSRMKGLSSWSKLKKYTDKFKPNFKYLITNSCSKVFMQKIKFLKA